MTKSIQLISSVALSDDDLEGFVIVQKGKKTKNGYFPFAKSEGQSYVYIALDPQELKDLLGDLKDPTSSNAKVQMSKLQSSLGGKPRTVVIIVIGRAEGSDALTYDFVLRFGERWPVVVLDNVGDLVSLEDMRHRRDAGTEL